jgi:hypothetical protein
VWRHDVSSISESTLVLGGLVISSKGKSRRLENFPNREKQRRLHIWSEFFIPYVGCRRTKCIYTWVTDGQIVYRIYIVFKREKNLYTKASSR